MQQNGGRPNKQASIPLPLGGSGLPGHQVQLTVMQTYRITMQSVLRASGCAPTSGSCTDRDIKNIQDYFLGTT